MNHVYSIKIDRYFCNFNNNFSGMHFSRSIKSMILFCCSSIIDFSMYGYIYMYIEKNNFNIV